MKASNERQHVADVSVLESLHTLTIYLPMVACQLGYLILPPPPRPTHLLASLSLFDPPTRYTPIAERRGGAIGKEEKALARQVSEGSNGQYFPAKPHGASRGELLPLARRPPGPAPLPFFPLLALHCNRLLAPCCCCCRRCKFSAGAECGAAACRWRKYPCDPYVIYTEYVFLGGCSACRVWLVWKTPPPRRAGGGWRQRIAACWRR